jgi:hypothetical protein
MPENPPSIKNKTTDKILATVQDEVEYNSK